MKTPRQILFQRHQPAVPKLDRIRADVLPSEWPHAAESAKRHEPNILPAGLLRLWCELIVPSQRAWAGFAVIWIALLAINLATSETRENGSPMASSAQVIAAFEQQRQLLAELFRPEPPQPAVPSPQLPPQARGRSSVKHLVS
ncbi:MAG: hypothetical protein M3463_02695 [Verrucomicrobiota bacterium]|nr:hypothetical protein [Verrucomicrobiota bacterium]